MTGKPCSIVSKSLLRRPRAKSLPHRAADRAGIGRAARAGRRATTRRWRARATAKNAIVYRAVRLIAESIGGSSFVLYEGAAELTRASAARPVGAAQSAPGRRFAHGKHRRPSAARRQRLCRGGGPTEVWRARAGTEHAGARALRAAARPHESGAGAGRLAASLRIHGGGADRALRPERRPAADPASDFLQSGRRLLRPQPAGSRRGRGRHPQRRRQVEQGAARQRGAAFRRAGLFRRRTGWCWPTSSSSG